MEVGREGSGKTARQREKHSWRIGRERDPRGSARPARQSADIRWEAAGEDQREIGGLFGEDRRPRRWWAWGRTAYGGRSNPPDPTRAHTLLRRDACELPCAHAASTRMPRCLMASSRKLGRDQNT
eukprot:scaffold64983_cov31-Tisochrysis_lutea.AAC.1